MRTNIVFTLTGTDRVGIVEEVTQLLLELDGNVEASRMARLGGEFAMLMLVSLPSEKLPALDKTIANLNAQGFKVTTSQTKDSGEAHPGWLTYQIKVIGADHEGIVHEIAQTLSQRGINIENLETETTRAPISGTPLFTMTASVAVPKHLRNEDWKAALEDAARHLNVDINVSQINKQ